MMSVTKKMTLTAILAAVATVLFFLNFPIPFFPPFIKMDFSNVPALFATFVISPFAGVMIELIKNIFNFMNTTTGGVGELAAFMIGSAYMIGAGVVFKAMRRRSIVMPLVVGTAVMTIVAAAANYWILFPLYSKFMPIEAIIKAASALIPIANTYERVILFSIIPFNIIKGAVSSIITIVLYKKLAKLIRIDTM